jgi:hypothetical protein
MEFAYFIRVCKPFKVMFITTAVVPKSFLQRLLTNFVILLQSTTL